MLKNKKLFAAILILGALLALGWYIFSPQFLPLPKKNYYCEKDIDCVLIHEHCCHGCGATDSVNSKSARHLNSYWLRKCAISGYSIVGPVFREFVEKKPICYKNRCQIGIEPDCPSICRFGSVEVLQNKIQADPYAFEGLQQNPEEIWAKCKCQ